MGRIGFCTNIAFTWSITKNSEKETNTQGRKYTAVNKIAENIRSAHKAEGMENPQAIFMIAYSARQVWLLQR